MVSRSRSISPEGLASPTVEPPSFWVPRFTDGLTREC